jgi:uncharacterized protein with NRDE domain
MCLILVLFKVRPDFPLIIAANREERRDRRSLPPFRWDTTPTIWAGRDEAAGGTWLGVNDAGLIASITNRPERPVDPALPSRGGLCLAALEERSPAGALAQVEAGLAKSAYNPFNLGCANVDEGWVTSWNGATKRLRPGRHVISNRGDPDDDKLGVVRRARRLLHGVDLVSPPLEELLPRLAQFCSNTGGASPVCRPGGDRGTVSSSLIALNPDGSVAAYWHANGPPSLTPYDVVRL